MNRYEVTLNIGNNTTDEHVFSALLIDEPEVADEIMNLDDSDNICLIITHKYSAMTGKQLAK